MAMEMSLGKRSRNIHAWIMVETSSTATIRVDMRESTIDRDLVKTVLTSMQYLTVAIAAPVIGKV